MSKKLPYALVALGGLALGGITCGSGGTYLGYKTGFNKGHDAGFDKGYNESEPEILIFNYQEHGIDGMCVMKNDREMVCAADADKNGSVDIALFDLETQEVKDSISGKHDCVGKGYSPNLEEKLKEQ